MYPSQNRRLNMYTKNELLFNSKTAKIELKRRSNVARNLFKRNFEKMLGKTFKDQSHWDKIKP